MHKGDAWGQQKHGRKKWKRGKRMGVGLPGMGGLRGKSRELMQRNNGGREEGGKQE